MGTSSSKERSYLRSCDESCNSKDARVFSLPNGLLVDVLSFVPARDLVMNCRLVCKSWKDVIDGQSVWKIKCERENKLIPVPKLEKIPLHHYRVVYCLNPYGTNLIFNPCGEDGLNGWKLSNSELDETIYCTLVPNFDGFVVQDPPKGAESVPPEVGSTSCFALSNFPCKKNQIIDLVARGIHPDVLDCQTTKIEVGEWYTAQFECSYFYKLDVILLDDNYSYIYSKRRHNKKLSVENCIVKRFEFEHKKEQWSGKEWHKVIHTFENVGKTRYIFFQHSRNDWEEFYRCKMTGAFVRVII